MLGAGIGVGAPVPPQDRGDLRARQPGPARAGFTTTVLLDLCAGVAPDTTKRSLVEMTAAGVTVR